MGRQNNIISFLFLLFSNVIFNYFFESSFGRSEIFYYALIAYASWITYTKNFSDFFKHFIFIQFLYMLLLLIHEAFIFFYPYLFTFFIYYLYKNNNSITYKNIFTGRNGFVFVMLIFTILLEFLILLYGIPGTRRIETILYTLIPLNSWFSFEDFYFLNLDLWEHVHNFVLPEIFHWKTFLIYFILTIFVVIGFFPLKERIRKLMQYKWMVICILFSWLGTILLSLISMDIGRWLHINFFSIFFIILLFNSEHRDKEKNNQKQWLIQFAYVLLFLFYISFWHILTCCVRGFTYKDIYKKNPIFLFAIYLFLSEIFLWNF